MVPKANSAWQRCSGPAGQPGEMGRTGKGWQGLGHGGGCGQVRLRSQGQGGSKNPYVRPHCCPTRHVESTKPTRTRLTGAGGGGERRAEQCIIHDAQGGVNPGCRAEQAGIFGYKVRAIHGQLGCSWGAGCVRSRRAQAHRSCCLHVHPTGPCSAASLPAYRLHACMQCMHACMPTPACTPTHLCGAP